MANKIQIKRSVANATVTGLSNGELAFTQAGNTLHIGLPDGSGTLRIGGAQYPGTLTNSHALVANSTGAIDKIIVANLQPTSVYANGSLGTAGQVLVSNGSTVYWGTGTSGANTEVQFNDSGVSNGTPAFTFNKSTNTLFVSNSITASIANLTGNVASSNTTTGTLTIAGGVGVNGRINATDIAVGNDTVYATLNSTTYTGSANNASYLGGVIAASYVQNTDSRTLSGNLTFTGTNFVVTGTSANISSNVEITADLNVTGSTKLGNNFGTDIVSLVATVNTEITPSANVTYDLGRPGLRWDNVYSNNITALTANIAGNLSVGGNVYVTGNVFALNVQTLSISDPLIHLAANNEDSDLLDIGFVGHYSDDAGVTKRHAGLFRDASDSGIFKLFNNLVQADLDVGNTVIINTAAASYVIATLNAFIDTGSFLTNTSHVVITANSTVNVSIYANNLTLSNPLEGNSGGTGLSTISNNSILVGNSTNGYNALTLGTDGYVLQSNGTALVYDILDGGTF